MSAYRSRGFTLIEVLVSLGIFSILGSLLIGFAISSSRVTGAVDDAVDLTGESRLAFERMARELRQARAIDAVQFSSSSATTTAITFWTDFNGDDERDFDDFDPEVLTYQWEPNTMRLTLTADTAAGPTMTRPILNGRVESFTLELRSSLWQYDGADGSKPDGVVDWRELDAADAPVGNNNGQPDSPELTHIDLIAAQMVVSQGDSSQTFMMQVDLRNMGQN